MVLDRHHCLSAGPVFGNMNQFTGLGIFVDTYPNAAKNHDVSDSPRSFCFISVLSHDVSYRARSFLFCPHLSSWEDKHDIMIHALIADL